MSEGRTSAAWFLIALVPLVLGVSLAVHFFFSMKDQIEGMPRVEVPGEGEVKLSAGEYVIYGEPHGGSFRVRCTVADAETGEQVSLSSPTGHTTYNMFGRSGESMFEMDVPREGTYRVACEGDDGSGALAIGHGIGWSIAGMVLAILGGVFGMIVAIIVVAVKRMKRRGPPPVMGPPLGYPPIAR